MDCDAQSRRWHACLGGQAWRAAGNLITKVPCVAKRIRAAGMLALKGKHGTRQKVFLKDKYGARFVLLCVAALLSATACKKSERSDWRPDSMRSSDEWMKMALESPHPNERRRGVVGLAESRDASADWALRVYDKVARSDNDPSVRCAALRAMERIADPQSEATALAVLQSDRKPIDGVVAAPSTVRWGAARVLRAIAPISNDSESEGSRVASGLVDAVNSEPDHRTRLTLIDTLGFYRDRSATTALIDSLDDDDFAIRRAAESSLVALTGVTHHYDADAWRAWFAKTGDPFASAGQTPPGWDEPDEKPKWDWF